MALTGVKVKGVNSVLFHTFKGRLFQSLLLHVYVLEKNDPLQLQLIFYMHGAVTDNQKILMINFTNGRIELSVCSP